MLKSILIMCLMCAVAAGSASAGQHVRVAVFDNPPLMTYDRHERRTGGIFIDVLRFTAAREGWELEEVPGEPSDGLQRLQAGEVDLLAAVPHSRSREERLSFSRETLAASWGRIYVRPDSAIQTIRDLAGKNVALLKGSLLQHQLLRGAEGGSPPTLLEYQNFAQAFNAVVQGRAEAVLANRFTGAVYARETGLHPISVVLAPYGFRFATRPNADMERMLDAIDRNLLLLKSNPDSFYYRDLEELEDSLREPRIPGWMYWGSAVVLIAMATALLWGLSMRRAAARVARSEAQLRKAHEQVRIAHEELYRFNANSPDLIAVFDRDFTVKRLNPASQTLLGAPPGQFIGRSALELVPHERRESSRAVLERVRSGARLQGHSSQVLRADGTVVPFLWSLAWSEQSQELYAIGHDDTNRHELISHLQVVNRDLETFARSVSNDLRGPLAAVVGFIGKVLREDGNALQPRSRELLTRAHAASQRMDDIIANLLLLTRVTEGGVHRRDCDATAMCEDILTALRHADPGRAVTVDIQPDMRAHADRELLRQVFDNLLSNAWKFTSRKPQANITVACRQDPKETVFFVHDDGAGFDMEYAHNLFLPFGRLHSRLEFGGIGIGLCVAHRVVTAHGGRIWAQGTPGLGAVFSFTLGIQRAAAGAATGHACDSPDVLEGAPA